MIATKCLYVEDHHAHVEMYKPVLDTLYDTVFVAEDFEEAMPILEENGDELDVVIVDMKLAAKEYGGYEVLRFARQYVAQSCTFVIVSAEGYAMEPRDLVRDAIYGRDVVFFDKGDAIDIFDGLMARTANRARYTKQRARREEVIASPATVDLYANIDLVIGPSRLSTIIVGDTGVGKEHLARQIHSASGLPPHNFRPINCAAFSRSLVMGELFGHTKGAFTDARAPRIGILLEASGVQSRSLPREEPRNQDGENTVIKWLEDHGDLHDALDARKLGKLRSEVRGLTKDLDKLLKKLNELHDYDNEQGYVEWLEECGNVVEFDEESTAYYFPEAGGGTLFLDEVGDLPLEAQGALLRFLDGRGIRPVGYHGPPLRPGFIRLIAATNKVDALLDKERFRPDFFWRLAEWVIPLAPLTERLQDAIGAAERRLRNESRTRYSRRSFELSQDARETLESWISEGELSSNLGLTSGNFRTLNALLDRACWFALAEGHVEDVIVLEPDHLSKAWDHLRVSV